MKTLREIVSLIEKYDNNIDNLSLDGARDIIHQIVGKKCPYCLHGWRRDVEDSQGNQSDEECWTCDGTGYLG